MSAKAKRAQAPKPRAWLRWVVVSSDGEVNGEMHFRRSEARAAQWTCFQRVIQVRVVEVVPRKARTR